MTLITLLNEKGMSFNEIYDQVGGAKSLLKEKLQNLEDEGLIRSNNHKYGGKRIRIYKLVTKEARP